MSKLVFLILLVSFVTFSCATQKNLKMDASADPVGAPVEIKAPLGLPPVPIPADNRPTANSIALGRRLFYDVGLSGDNTISCASCHLPRRHDQGSVSVVHNQNDNLRPNEKMVRDVCLPCHGLGFSLDALADTALVKKNFRGRPARRLETLNMVEKRQKTN